MESFLRAETLIIELLLLASIIAIGVRRLRIPYTVALVLVGLLITLQPESRLELTPELILALFVPPLVFEAAFHIDVVRLRQQWQAIITLAVPGVLLTMLIVGLIVAWRTPLGLPTALLFGALISATDPVAVVALFRSLGAPKTLTLLVEGESLFNDGTAIVIFNLMLAIVLTNQFNPLASLSSFLVVSAGGVAVGLVLGWLIARVIALVDDYLIETTLTTVLAYGAYLVADRLHVSGVLAVVAAGILSGNLGPRGMSPTTKIVLFNFWEYLAFVANSMVFLLIGLQIDLSQLAAQAEPIAIAVVAVIISRLVIYGLLWLLDRPGSRIPMPYRHVLFWGGLRGAISLALVLSLPAALTYSDLLRVMTFGVVLFTLLVQGTTMQLLLKRLGLVERSADRLAYERTRGELLAVRAGIDQLRRLQAHKQLPLNVWETVGPRLEAAEAALQAQIRDLLRRHPELEAEETESVLREGLRAQRSMLDELLRDGVISEEAYRDLIGRVDAELQSDQPKMIGLRDDEGKASDVEAQA
ncbi:MAG: Na+/H+ antiporter [Anaerolineae bacterium]|nr:Na+/H+ antiporter [Anaerolineae bacterium]